MIKNKVSKIICDTDFLISLHLSNESTHLEAKKIWEKNLDSEFYVLNLTKYEIATVLSRKLSQKEAVEVIKLINLNFEKEVWFEQKWQSEVYDIFESYSKKNISYFDCACLFLAEKIDAKIASFDKFYPEEVLV